MVFGALTDERCGVTLPEVIETVESASNPDVVVVIVDDPNVVDVVAVAVVARSRIDADVHAVFHIVSFG